MSAAPPTFAAQMTPPGHGAIATLALWGPAAWEVVRAQFHPAGPHALPAVPEEGRIWLGHLGRETGDQVVLTVRRQRGHPWVEAHCHGGPEVVRLIAETLESHGVAICSWPELLRHGGDSSLRALAAAALSEAPTVRTAGILLDQHVGALDRALGEIRAAWARQDRAEVENRLAELVRYVSVGRHLTTPWRVVVAGAPNVGKSSLVNALAGFHRCVVSPTPGTTRDLITTVIALDGWPVELVDTAGLRDNAGGLEAQGMDLARSAAAGADLVLWVLDASAPPVWPPAGLAARLVVNKTDLPAAWDLGSVNEAPRVSAVTREGLAELGNGLAGWLVPEAPPPGAAVPFTHAPCDRVEAAWTHWRAGREQEALQCIR